MATIPLNAVIPLKNDSPVSRARERTTWTTYIVACLAGLVPSALGASGPLAAAGLGLLFPGAGFLTLGPWGFALALVTMAIFLLSLIAWFGAGMIVAPAIVWLGSLALAAAFAPPGGWAVAPYAAAGLALAGMIYLRRSRAGKESANLKARELRNAFLPEAIQTLRAEQKREVPARERELDIDQLRLLRYAFDRALQPVESFQGFNRIDQFQTAAIRYQINALAYALSLSQCHYTPSFHGYLSLAQRNLIEKYLLKEVWNYWIYESMWGHLNFTNFDPAGKDNVMLTGFLGIQVGLYVSNTGDRRYFERGSLPFVLNGRTTFEHSLDSVVASVARNFDQSEFCLYPCEPNWIYPICNHYGMTALTLNDRLTGATNVQRVLPRWLEALDTELTDSKGSPVALKSSLTGWMPPFPAADGTYVPFANCFIPERAERLWSIARTEMKPLVSPGVDGIGRLKLPGAGIDFGNYKKGHAMNYAFIKMAAREMGDDDFARMADEALNDVGGHEVVDGVASYSRASNIGNAYSIIAAMQQRNDLRNAVVRGPDPGVLDGPILAEASYPDVLVAKAYSSGEDLHLVLWPGNGAGKHRIALERLVPDRAYRVAGDIDSNLRADPNGRATLEIALDGRTELSFFPAD